MSCSSLTLVTFEGRFELTLYMLETNYKELHLMTFIHTHVIAFRSMLDNKDKSKFMV